MFNWLKGERPRDHEAADWDDVSTHTAPLAPVATGHTPAADPPPAQATQVVAAEAPTATQVDLAVELAGMRLPNPLMTASGCAANGRELDRFFDLGDLGAFVTKTVMAAPRSGRGTPRMAETPSGMLNSIGLQGPGIEAFVEQDLAWLKSAGARVLVSIAGHDAAEFAHVARVLRDCDAADAVVGVEVNISCPNVANRGLVFSCDPRSSAEVVSAVVAELPAGLPAFAKLTADVTDIVPIAGAALDSGAAGLTMINTLLGMSIDTRRMRPHLGGVTGGLSGPAIRPVAVRAVWQVQAAMLAGVVPTAPIIGVGGVRTGEDALEFIAAGASAVQVGTVVFHDPNAPVRVRDELALALAQRGLPSVTEVIGAAQG